MKKTILIFIALQSILFAGAQKRVPIPMELFFGIKLFQQDINKQLQTTGYLNNDHSLQVTGVGTAIHGYELKLNGKRVQGSGVNLHYSRVLHKNIMLDSLKLCLSGYNVNYVCDWDLFQKNKKFDLLYGFGISLGRIKIKDYESAYFIKKNAFFCPIALLYPRYKIWKLFLGLRTEYFIDLSHYKWKQIKVIDKPLNLNKLNQTGASLFFTISSDF